jgi:hypothetical protein
MQLFHPLKMVSLSGARLTSLAERNIIVSILEARRFGASRFETKAGCRSEYPAALAEPQASSEEELSSTTIALGGAAIVFVCGAVVLSLQHALPARYTTGGPRDMIGRHWAAHPALGARAWAHMIWTAYGVYSGQNAAVQSYVQRVLQKDMALADYGPEAAPTLRKDSGGSEARDRSNVGPPPRWRRLRFPRLSRGGRKLSRPPSLPGLAAPLH